MKQWSEMACRKGYLSLEWTVSMLAHSLSLQKQQEPIVMLLLLLLCFLLAWWGWKRQRQKIRTNSLQNASYKSRRRRSVNFVRTRSRTDSWNQSSRRFLPGFATAAVSRPPPRSATVTLLQDTMRRMRNDTNNDTELQVDALADQHLLVMIQDEERQLLLSPRSPKVRTSRESLLDRPYWHGPGVGQIQYDTFTPPPPWKTASRNLLAKSSTWKTLERQIILVLCATPTISIQQQGPKQVVYQQDIRNVSFHVHRPLEGGVLELYTIGRTDQRQQHTFASGRLAAQFQLDALSLRILGPSIYNLYQALMLLHRGGSSCSEESEPVLQYTRTRGEEETTSSSTTIAKEDCGVAWDDVMRCLGVHFKWMRLRLDAMRWLAIHGRAKDSTKETASPTSSDNKGHQSNSTSAAGSSKANASIRESSSRINPEYTDHKRLLLGPVDFFRLFVPRLPHSAIPEGDSSSTRFAQFLRWRKRIARASVLVQWYVRAKVVANIGWQLGPSLTPSALEGYWKHRQAFDDNDENSRHDHSTKHEYYEASVSRDVSCQVRSAAFLKRKRCWWKCGLDDAPQELSSYQGYTLVAMHSFQWEDDASLPLHFSKDPVHSIPGLESLIRDHSKLDFFVNSIFFESRQTAVVHVYARSLPIGFDPTFDTVVNRFITGDAELRRRKLEVILQLGVGKDGLNLIARCLLYLLSFLLRLRLGGRKQVPQSVASGGRTTIPALNVAQCGNTFHFGGALQTDPRLPTNYVSCTCHMGSKRNNNFVTRVLLSYVEFGIFELIVTDMTVVFAGELEDELPERAVGTIRTVREPSETLLLSHPERTRHRQSGMRGEDFLRRRSNGVLGLCTRVFVADPLIACSSSIVQSVRGFLHFPRGDSSAEHQLVQRNPRLDVEQDVTDINEYVTDPLEKAVNEIVRALQGIELPVGQGVHSNHEQLPVDRLVSESPPSLPGGGSSRNANSNLLILRAVSRADIKRFLIASNCSLRATSESLITTVLWRNRTFPIDTRTCRIELQSGQFFHQGADLDGNPIFYFRNLCLGPWRKDEDAVIAAVLHRFESHLSEWCKTEPQIKCTLIVLQGRPYSRKPKNTRLAKGKATKKEISLEQATTASTAPTTLDGKRSDDDSELMVDDETAINVNDGWEEAIAKAQNNNPRIPKDELWYSHTSKNLIVKLVDIAQAHYPERLDKALVVLGHGCSNYVRSRTGAAIALGSLVKSPRTREKVHFLSRYSDLQKYVDPSQLITTVGGTRIEDPTIFECK